MSRRTNDTPDPLRDSSHRLLCVGDFEAFRPGRLKSDILKDIQWRGNFEMACMHQEESVSAISYGLVASNCSVGLERNPGAEKDVVWAIFRDYKFVKFVEWPPTEMEDYDYEGTTASRPKPIMAGDFHRLIQAAQGTSVNIVELEREIKKRPPTPSHVDPGLTAAWLVLKARGVTPTLAIEKDYKENAEVRSQFNAARVMCGMSEQEVEVAFKAMPLESGRTHVGSFKVFGSNKAFSIPYPLRFSNVLVLFEEGKVSGIYSGESIPSGDKWRQQLGDVFSDLPAPRR